MPFQVQCLSVIAKIELISGVNVPIKNYLEVIQIEVVYLFRIIRFITSFNFSFIGFEKRFFEIEATETINH